MSRDFLIAKLHTMGGAKRENRKKVTGIVLEQPHLFPHLVAVTFAVDTKTSIKAAWVLEWICTHHGLDLLLPQLDFFTQNISKLRFDSAIRPCAKICERLAIVYTSTTQNNTKELLKKVHIDTIITTGFDWLLTPQKIAVRAYTMNTLYLFGKQKQYSWIHPELTHLIQTKIIHESAGCKARGRKILELIAKNNG